MAALIGKLCSLASYFCVATVLTVGGTVGYLRVSGILSDDKLQAIGAVLNGATLAGATETEQQPKEDDDEQPSYENREQARDLRARNLELRELALNNRLEMVRSELRTLMTDKERNERLKTTFKDQLASMRDETLTSGMENVRLLLENIKPKQAKELIMQMLEEGEMEDAVSLLSSMPIERRAKIAMEFKTKEDAAKLDEILRMIREGEPEAGLVDKTLQQLQP